MRRQVRFGIGSEDGERFSPTFKAKASARGDVYISSSHLPESLHISIHDDPDHWNIRVTERGDVKRSFPILPGRFVPGIVRAFSVLVHGSTLKVPPNPKKVSWVRLLNPDLLVAFAMFVEDPWDGDVNRWPGKNAMGAMLIERLDLGDEDSEAVLTIVASGVEHPGLDVADLNVAGFDDPDEARVRFREGMKDPDSFVFHWYTLADGSTGAIAASGSFFNVVEEE